MYVASTRIWCYPRRKSYSVFHRENVCKCHLHCDIHLNYTSSSPIPLGERTFWSPNSMLFISSCALVNQPNWHCLHTVHSHFNKDSFFGTFLLLYAWTREISHQAHSIENETFCSKLNLDLDIFSAYFCHMQ